MRPGRARRRPAAVTSSAALPGLAWRIARSDHPLIAWARKYRDVLIPFFSSRLVIVVLMGFSTMIVAPGENGPRGGVVGILTQGDGARYVEIAQSGYRTGADTGLFPLYPMLVSLASIVFRDAAVTAMLISNLALFAAGILLKELLDRQHNDRAFTRSAVTFLMFSPVSFFFSGAYVESTLLMLTLGALLAAHMRRWGIAAAAGACASASNPLGMVVLLPLMLEYSRARRKRNGTSIAPGQRLLLFAVVPLGCAAFLCFSWLQFGDALAPLSSSDVFKTGLVTPLKAVSMTALIPPFYRGFTLLMLGSALALLCAGVLLRVRASYMLYALALIAIYACSPALPSIARWLCVVFPLYIILAALVKRFEWTFEPLLACSFTLLAFCTVLTANGHWLR